MTTPATTYPARLWIDYPGRDLDRVSTFFRLVYAIPVLIVLALVATGEAAGILFFPVLLMIVFRRKYPFWWFDWNLQLSRFHTRVWAYVFLMDDRYPSTDESPSVHLDLDRPDVEQDLNRWLPLVKWLLAIPHFVVLAVLGVGVLFAVLFAWFAILFTGRYPIGLFRYVEGVLRWGLRVQAYAFLLITDRYPPFSLD